MVTDITVVGAEQPLLDFDTFVRRDLPRVCHAVRAVTQDQATAVPALEHAVQELLKQTWPFASEPLEVQLQAFQLATARLVAPDLGRVVTVAHHWFDQPIEHVAAMIERTLADTAPLLAQTEPSFRPEWPDVGPRARVRAEVAGSPVVHVDVDRLVAERRRSRARQRAGVLSLVAALGLAAALFIGQVVQPSQLAQPSQLGQPDGTPTALPEPSTQPAPAPSPPARQTIQPPPPFSGLVGPAPFTRFARPGLDHMIDDGAGGFVAVRTPASSSAVVEFLTSSDGIFWQQVADWQLQPGQRVTRLKRFGPTYLVVVEDEGEDRLRSAGEVAATIATSEDLQRWTTADLDLVVREARGLIYEPTITDVFVTDTDIVAEVNTHVEIDFAALLLSEGYTCGHRIEQTRVAINLCNGAELDVLSVANIEELPERQLRMVSREGQPFTAALTNDAQEQSLPPARVQLPSSAFGSWSHRDVITVRAAAFNHEQPYPTSALTPSNDPNHLVGVGHLSDGRLAIFSRGATTSAMLLRSIVPDVSSDVRAVIAVGPTRWVIYLHESSLQGWLISSADGSEWTAVQVAAANTTEPRLFAGDDEALLQWQDDNDTLVTLAVPLPTN